MPASSWPPALSCSGIVTSELERTWPGAGASAVAASPDTAKEAKSSSSIETVLSSYSSSRGTTSAKASLTTWDTDGSKVCTTWAAILSI